ncbi:MAG: hypothetical protein WAU36_03275 [Cyclobacteriaceae bacterium]
MNQQKTYEVLCATRMKTVFVLCLVMGLLLHTESNAQLSEVKTDGKIFRTALYYGKMTNEWSGKIENEKFSAIVFDISYSRSTYGNFKFQSSHRYKILGDVIALLYTKPGIAEKPTPGTPTLTSVIGWHNYGLSLVSTQYVQFSAGGHIGDYFYGVEGLHSSRKAVENTSGTIYYYGGFGPLAMVDVSIPGTPLVLHYEGSYAFTFGEKPVSPDQQPEILNQMFELRLDKVFFNLEIVSGLNDWSNRIKRQQFGIGFMF